MKALAYTRVSTKAQIEGDSFLRQAEAIQRWADQNGHTIMEEFREEGVSGAVDAVARPALSRLFVAVVEEGIETVVIERSDRLARDLIVSEMLLKQFADIGVRVIEAESGSDLTVSDNPTARMVRQIVASVAEFDRSTMTSRMQMAKQRIRESGQRCEGRKPYGHHPEEQPALNRMIALRSAGHTMQAIADTLNGEQLPTRSGVPWTYGGVAKIVNRHVETPDELVG